MKSTMGGSSGANSPRVPSERISVRIPINEFSRVGRVLEHLTTSSYGVHGQAKFVRAPASKDNVVLTSCSSQLLGANIQLEPGVGRVLLKLVEAQRRSHGDGGLTVVACAAKLLRKAGMAIDNEGAKPQLIEDELCDAMNSLEKILSSPMSNSSSPRDGISGMVRRVQLNDLATIKSVIKSMIRPKTVCSLSMNKSVEDAIGSITSYSSEEASEKSNEQHLDSLATKLLDALLSSLDPERAEPLVHILAVDSGNIEDSISAPHTVLMDIPLPTGAELAIGSKKGRGSNMLPMRIALFDTSLEGVPRGQNRTSQQFGSVGKVGAVEIDFDRLKDCDSEMSSGSSQKNGWSPGEMERLAEEVFVTRMHSAGVTVVASQKTIHRSLKRLLMSYGIVPLERLSLRYIRAAACVTGAPVLGHSALRLLFQDVENLTTGEQSMYYGALKSLNVRRIGNRKYLQLVGYPNVKRPISTLVLRASCKHALRELEETCKGILRAVPRLFHEPYILPGAGKTELLAASLLRQIRPQSLGLRMLADTVEEIGYTAAGSGSLNSGGSSSRLVWDIACVRINAFRLAQEAACACLRMDSMLLDRY